MPPSSVPQDLDAMVPVPAGSFLMGATEGDSDERPVRRVNLRTFWIDKYRQAFQLDGRVRDILSAAGGA